MTLIFKTIHGSHLYGLAHPKSDADTFTVVTDDHDFGDRPTRQVVRGYGDKVTDDLTFTLSEFLKRIGNGSHQSLEALFSPLKAWESAQHWFEPFTWHYRATSPEVFYTYERTIRKFAYGDFKRRRHGVRLAQNLRDLRHDGRFNARMTNRAIVEANQLANELTGNALLRRLDIPTSNG